MLALAVGVLGAGGWFLWHLLRRPEAPRVLSFARFLPDLARAERPRARLTLRPPLRSAAFWLRMAAAVLLLAALGAGLDRPRTGGPAVGLRLVVDVSASMGVADGAGTRLDTALAVARDMLAQARAAGGPVCARVVAVAAGAGPPLGEDDLAQLAPRAEGAGPSVLVAAAVAPVAGDCPLTHAAVLTDHRRPPVLPDGPVPVIWRQVGVPVANAGIVAAAEGTGSLSGGGAVLAVEVATWPPGAAPSLTLTGPGGARDLPLVPLPDRPGHWAARVPHPGAGRYALTLAPGGALAADDRMALDLSTAAAPAVDWRLPQPMPRGLAAASGPGALLVAAIDSAEARAALDPATARPVIAVWPGWDGGGRPRQIGAFVEAPDLTGALNLDVFEAEAPLPLPHPLPPGFSAVLTDRAGQVFLARRGVPPGLLLPAPAPGAPGQAGALSLVLFYQGLAALAGQGVRPLTPDWRLADGTPVPGAGLEGDTARPLDDPDPVDLSPRAAVARAPVWPLLVVLALACLLAERALALWSGVRRAV